MTVSKEIIPLEHSAKKLTIKVGKDDVGAEYDKIVSDYSKTLQLPGFRKGKVPKNVLERKLGDALKGEVLGHIVEHALADVFEGEDFPKEDRPLAYSSPALEGEPVLELGADFVFSVTYDVLPQVTVGQWKGLEIEIPDVSVTDEDVNRELEEVRDRNAIVLDKDEGLPAAKGDVVTVNYSELSATGDVELGTEREDFVFTLGSGHNVFKFDDELVGMKKDETRDLEKTYAEDFEDPELAGKTKKIRVHLTALKEKKLPELDDDLAQDVDEKFQTLEDLKVDIRARLAKNLESRLRDLKVNRVLEKIMENTPVDLPESMIRMQLNSRWRNLARKFGIPPENLSKMLQNSDNVYDEVAVGWRPDAVKALHSRLIVDSLIQELNLDVSDEDKEKEIASIASQGGSSLAEIKNYYEKEGMQDYLAEEIKERKCFDLLLSENSVKIGSKENYLDLMADNG